MMGRLWFLFFSVAALSMLSHVGKAQQRLSGNFQKDTIYIAEEVKYSLSYLHPKEEQVIFPDTNYDFSPFELVRKRVFNTVTTDSMSLDSAVYYLRTFKAYSPLSLALRIVLLTDQGDSTIISSNTALINLHLQITDNPKNYLLRPDTELVLVAEKFNYPYFLLFGIGGLGVVVGIFYSFRRTIVRRYRLYTLRKSHTAFIKAFEKNETKLLVYKDLSDLENIIADWKLYLSRLEESPINTYTTTEIVSIFQNEELGNTLQHLDRCIYGGTSESEFQKPLSVLKRFTIQRFQKRKKEVRNA